MGNTAHSFAAAADAPACLPPERAAALLADLRLAHQDLLGALGGLEALTSHPEPDAGRYPGARWRLSLASRKRRQLTSAACAELLPVAPPVEAEAIERLRRDEASRLRETAAHIHAWPTANVSADWAGYCAASLLVRRSMRARIAAEQAALYPLLEHFARGGV
ncbi:hypothetical protein [Sphingosinicella sp.]|uniref:hypothetical protein n=1 Tax=Sphingosinicella sp. TaxID=1917971 RepID=UPI0040380F1F